tara:strand:- start:676 stop:789 length:114 start_codon:yes stop_codon:yes gene_type:complete
VKKTRLKKALIGVALVGGGAGRGATLAFVLRASFLLP